MEQVDILLIETFSYCPHLETAGEISLDFHEKGFEVVFSFILFDNILDYSPSIIRRTLLFQRRIYRVKALINKLNSSGLYKTEIFTPQRHQVQLIFNQIRPSLDAANNIEEIKLICYDSIKIGMAVASSYISLMGDPFPSINKKIIARLFKAAIATYLGTQQLIEKFKPLAVITFNGRFATSKPIIDVCKNNDIRIMYHERGANETKYFLDYCSPHSFICHRKNMNLLWQSDAPEDKVATAKSYFERKISGEGIGWFSFTRNQVKNLIPEQRKLKRWTYFSSSDDEYAAVEDAIEHPLFESQFEAIKWLISFVDKIDNTELLIRVHPHKKFKSKRLRRWWEDLAGKNVTVIASDSPIDSYALANSSDLVIVYGSTIGAEAAYLGKPVILLGDAIYRNLGCVYEPSSITELEELLSQDSLSAKPKEATYPFGYYNLNYGKNFQYYKPENLFFGKFLGSYLSYYPPLIQPLHNLKIKIKKIILSRFNKSK